MKKLHSRILPLLLIVSGCASQAPTPVRQAPPKPMPVQHEVKYRGETLSKIAAWYTSSPENWTEIAAYNRHINPNSLVIGTIITIPEELVVKRDPLDQQFVIRKTPRPTRVAVRKTPKARGENIAQSLDTARAQMQPLPVTEDVVKNSAPQATSAETTGHTTADRVPTPKRRQEVLDELLD